MITNVKILTFSLSAERRPSSSLWKGSMSKADDDPLCFIIEIYDSNFLHAWDNGKQGRETSMKRKINDSLQVACCGENGSFILLNLSCFRFMLIGTSNGLIKRGMLSIRKWVGNQSGDLLILATGNLEIFKFGLYINFF